MKRTLGTSLLALSLLASLAAARTTTFLPTRLTAPETTELGLVHDPMLGELRAGRLAPPERLALDERAALQRATDEQLGLQDLRAGVITDHEWTLIAIGALVVLLIVVL